MKRFHVHLSVPDLAASVRFYSGLFGAAPTVAKPDYAKWMLDDPRVNFAISARGAGTTGLNHLGFQVDSDDELAGVRERFAAADASTTVAEAGAHCCYARSDKHWVQDPQGIAWEAFHTLEGIPVWGGGADAAQGAGCCSADATPAHAAARSGAAAAGCCAADATAASGTAAAGCCAPGATRAKAGACC